MARKGTIWPNVCTKGGQVDFLKAESDLVRKEKAKIEEKYQAERKFAYVELFRLFTHASSRNDCEKRKEDYKKKVKELEEINAKKTKEITWLEERSRNAADQQKELNTLTLKLRRVSEELDLARNTILELRQQATALDFMQTEMKLKEQDKASLVSINENIKKAMQIQKQELEAASYVATTLHALLIHFYNSLSM